MERAAGSKETSKANSRWKLGKLELAFTTHPDFETETLVEKREHAGEALAAWNHTLGISPIFGFRGSRRIDEFVPAVKQWNTRNTALVAESQGYTELHPMLASVCPDEVLRHHELARPTGNFQLWPFTIEPSQRATFAKAAGNAFSDFIWRELVTKGIKRSKMPEDSSIRILIDDTRFWMNALYRVGLDRLDRLPKTPPPEPDLNQAFSALMAGEVQRSLGAKSAEVKGRTLIVTHADGRVQQAPMAPLVLPELGLTLNPADFDGELSRLTPRPAAEGGHRVIWNPSDPADRDAVIQEMLTQPEVAESILPVLNCLKKDMLPEDLPDKGYSFLKEDVQRRLYDKRKKVKVVFGETVDDVPAYGADDPFGEGRALYRGILMLFDRRERKILILLRHGKSQNDIAAKIGLSRSRVSRLVSRIEQEVCRHLG